MADMHSNEIFTHEVKKVQFGILSPEKMREMSVMEVYKQLTNETNELSKNTSEMLIDRKNNTLADLRMGTIDRKNKCSTCYQTVKHCPGHFGRINLAKPVYQIHLFGQILKTLNCVCYRCSAILVQKDMKNKDSLYSILLSKKRNRFSFLEKELKKNKKKVCFHCGSIQPIRFVKDKDTYINIQAEFYMPQSEKDSTSTIVGGKRKSNMIIDVDYCLRILEGITDEDCELLGYDPKMSHPKWFIWTVMLVPPLSMRPTVKTDADKSSEDDLTHILNEIVKTNNMLRHLLNQLNKDETAAIQNCWNNLQWHVAVYIDNDQSSIPKCTNRSGRTLKSIRQRIIQKEGRIRGNLMGKRVDMSARTVITPDPNIDLDEVGVPYEICSNLTYPEIVTPYNIAMLYELIQNTNGYPSAKSIKSFVNNVGQSVITKELKYVKDRSKLVLNYGDIVYRNLLKNDIVAFNRQPSLTKMSMMGHRVRPVHGRSFRLNPNVTTPYNADFDGDEMNLHVPISMATVFELQLLTTVPTQIVSPQSSSPIINLVQDSLLGMYRMTSRNNNILTLKNYMTLLGTTNEYVDRLSKSDADLDFSQLKITDILSFVFPEISKQWGDVKIINGYFEAGVLKKDIIKKIIHLTFDFYGPEEACRLFNKMNNIANSYLLMDGFSVGLSDITKPYTSNKESIYELNKGLFGECDQLLGDLFSGNIQLEQSIVPLYQYEASVLNKVEKVKAAINDVIIKTDKTDNRFFSMIESGSKGSLDNLRQVIGCLGQAIIEGSRVPFDINRRPLPHCYKDVLTPKERGYIVHSYLEGLTPMEYFYHAMQGRLTIISTSIKTSESGYIQRRLEKAMEDANIRYDNTVRNSNDAIIQIVYGTDGLDATHSVRTNLNSLNNSISEFTDNYLLNSVKLEAYLSIVGENLQPSTDNRKSSEILKCANQHFNHLMTLRKQLIEIYSFTNSTGDSQVLFTGVFPPYTYLPLDVMSFIEELKHKFAVSKNSISNLNPIYVCNQNEILMNYIITKNYQENDNLFLQYSTLQMRYALLVLLSPNSIIFEHHLSKDAYDYLILTIKNKYLKALISPGEQVGSIAAQSIGEPTTQATLDLFHNIGSASAKAPLNRGVPRLKEILNASRKLKTPSLKIYLETPFLYKTDNSTLDQAVQHTLNFSKTLQFTTLNYYINKTSFITNRTIITEDNSQLQNIYKRNDSQSSDKRIDYDSMPWVIRYVIDNSILSQQKLDKQVFVNIIRKSIEDSESKSILKSVLEESYPFIFITNDKSELVLYFHIKSLQQQTKSTTKKCISTNTSVYNTLIAIDKLLQDITIQGISGIFNTHIGTEKNDMVLNDGSVVTQQSDKFNNYKNNKQANSPYIETIGSNFQKVLEMQNVDTQRTVSNDLHEVNSILGIEATRQCIIHESLLVLGHDKVTNKHLALLADVMTSNGYIISVDRHGVNKSDIGPLARASFEETTLQLTNAAIYSETDYMTGVSANVMFGQFFKGGTNAFEPILDEHYLKNTIIAQKEDSTIFKNVTEELKTKDAENLCYDDRLFDFNYAF